MTALDTKCCIYFAPVCNVGTAGGASPGNIFDLTFNLVPNSSCECNIQLFFTLNACKLCLLCPLYGIRGRLLYFWTAKLQLGQLCCIPFSDFHKACALLSTFSLWSTVSRFNQSTTQWLFAMITMCSSNSWLVLFYNSSHSEDSLKG